MLYAIDETHDPHRRSWVESANRDGAGFPIQNLPFGVFRLPGETGEAPRIGVAIGDQILDLRAGVEAGLFGGLAAGVQSACGQAALNALMSLGHGAWSALRARLSSLLAAGSPAQPAAARCLVPRAEAAMLLPAAIGDYTDFYASIFHAKNVGSMFRPDNPLLPNYKYVPIAYHGRSSSIVPAGTAVKVSAGAKLKAIAAGKEEAP